MLNGWHDGLFLKNTFSKNHLSKNMDSLFFFSLKENRWIQYNFRFCCNLDNSLKTYCTQLFVLLILVFCHKASCHSLILAMGRGLSRIKLLKVKFAMIRKRVVWRTLTLHYFAMPCPSIWTHNRFCFFVPCFVYHMISLGENIDQQVISQGDNIHQMFTK